MNIIEELGLNEIDNILIIDKNFTIIYSVRFNKRFETPNFKESKDEFFNMNLFEVYPNLSKDDSSIVQAFYSGKPVIKKSQHFTDYHGRVYCTNNLSIPIVKQGKVVGVVELTNDITSIDNLESQNSVEKKYNFIDDNQMDHISFDDILSVNEEMKRNISIAKILSMSLNPTLVYGETGTGKEVFVQAMINASGISRDKVVIQNCASIPESLMESILFGTVKGAYTGAENKKGVFDIANGGILFLDEINSLSYSMQGKLLRVLQDGTFIPVGSNLQRQVSVKIISAMNVDPMEAISKNSFRRDLFYRFSGSLIKLTPLRRRREDIPLYIDYFINRYNIVYNKNITGINSELTNLFSTYPWEGNVRELKHIIEMMISISADKILTPQQLPAYMYEDFINLREKKILEVKEINPLSSDKGLSLNEKLEEVERQMIISAMNSSCGRVTAASKLLGIPRQTLRYKLDKYEINTQDEKSS